MNPSFARTLRLVRTFARHRSKSKPEGQTRNARRNYTTSLGAGRGTDQDRGGFASLGIKKGDKGERHLVQLTRIGRSIPTMGSKADVLHDIVMF
jgi:hypothetical protein